MKVTSVEKKEKSTVELTIQVEAEAFEAAVQQVYLKNRASMNVPGFRKGKAPRKIIEGMYGTGVFYEDAINELLPGAYDEAVKEQGLDDVGYPKIDIVDVSKDGFTFKALVSVRPEVKLGTYKGLSAAKESAKITEEDIDREMQTYIDRASRLVSVEREAQMGDTTVIDFEGFDNGVAFEGGKGENFDLKLGSGSFVPGFEEQLVGMKAGEEKDIDITFPEDYHADLAGKPVVFHVAVKEVKENQAPVVDDEFAKDVSEFDTLKAFRADLGDKLSQRRAQQSEVDYANRVMEQLVANMECEIPDAMVEVKIDQIMQDQAMRLQQQYGMSMEDYQKMLGLNEDMVRASIHPDALKQVQLELALTAVADAESLTVTDEELEAEMQKLADMYKLELAEVKAAVPAADMKADMLLSKARELVLGSAKVSRKKAAKKKAEESEETQAE